MHYQIKINKFNTKMEFEKTLWNKHDMLHERYCRQYKCCYNLIDMLTRMQSAARDYSKTIKNIYQKNLTITEDP